MTWISTFTATSADLNGSRSWTWRDEDYWRFSWIPVVGPWLMMDVAHTDEQWSWALISGIAQDLGFLMLVIGSSIRWTVRVPRRAERGDDAETPGIAVALGPRRGGAQVALTITHF